MRATTPPRPSATPPYQGGESRGGACLSGRQACSARISPGQIKKIHALKNTLALDDNSYREMVSDVHGFSSSSKDLSHEEAGRLIDKMEKEATAKGVWTPSPSPSPKGRGYEQKYEELGERPGMASPKQLRMIEGMWAEVSKHKHDAKARQAALVWFVYRVTGRNKLEWLERGDVQKVVMAIQRMKGGTKK